MPWDRDEALDPGKWPGKGWEVEARVQGGTAGLVFGSDPLPLPSPLPYLISRKGEYCNSELWWR